ncbi:hypothetical protein [Mucilaginibacter paludis]|uniref:DUF1579 domain-containing protein n=1 Tax=Mucilaginibacter paludis DSM 18603 TaxID=714943 RepID=H1Y1Q5_9SPHI|nr:hypothetical protein [Mucilaginibacter paludis]EHQ24714.1 hypothetical protein Mucpa_0522 [Mucilaginibacter paludis DSM 18603]
MHKIAAYKFLLFIFIISPIRAWSQKTPPADTLLDRLTGEWLLKGVIAGKQVEHHIVAEWVLGHQYLQLKETSREKQANGYPVYDAIVYITFDALHNQYDCLWLDNTSNVGLSNGIIAHAKREANQLALLFKFNDHSYFHTTLSYNVANSSWHWLMTSEDNDKVESFADAAMVKI